MGLEKSKSIIKPHDNIRGVSRVDYFDNRYYRVAHDESGQVVESHFPSVTSILGAYPKDFLAQWRGDVGNQRADQILAEATKMGSFVHYAAEVLCRNGMVVYNPTFEENYTREELDALEAQHNELLIVRFQKEWVQIRRIYMLLQMLNSPYIETEQTVYSVKHKFAGTLDLLMEIPEGSYQINGAKPLKLEHGLYLGDWKTGKSQSSTHLMQLAAYMYAIIEMTPELGEYIQGCMVFYTNSRTKTGIEGLSTKFIDRAECKMYFEQFLKVYEVYKIDNPIPKPTEFTMSSALSLNLELSNELPLSRIPSRMAKKKTAPKKTTKKRTTKAKAK